MFDVYVHAEPTAIELMMEAIRAVVVVIIVLGLEVLRNRRRPT